MGLESVQATGEGEGTSPENDTPKEQVSEHEFWNELINEVAAAKFLGLTRRKMQSYRQVGGGPVFRRLSARCIRYTRANLRDWANLYLRSSTSDSEPEDSAARAEATA